MTAVHQQHHYNRTASHEPMSTLSPSAAAGNNMSLHHHAAGGGSGAPRLSPGFHFPKSGLGTPDFFYAAGSPGAVHRVAVSGGGGHAEGAATPSWYKGPGLAAKREDSQGDDDNDGGSDVESAGKLHSRSDSSKSKQSTAGTTAPDETAKSGKPDDAGEEGLGKAVRAMSDPPSVRHSPAAWTMPTRQQRKLLDQEPNPFEHSFSSDKNPYDEMRRLQHQPHSDIGPARRVRSQSPPKSSHGDSLSQQAAHPRAGPSHVRLPGMGSMDTPSSELAQFGWALNTTPGTGGGDSLRAGPLSPSMLNGPLHNAGDSRSGVNRQIGGGGAGLFDPASIRTGLTPGGILYTHHHQSHLGSTQDGRTGSSYNPPHSPATQALFAMMTNSTPGLPSLTHHESPTSGSESGERGGRDSAQNTGSDTSNRQQTQPQPQPQHLSQPQLQSIRPSPVNSGSGLSNASGVSNSSGTGGGPIYNTQPAHNLSQAAPRPIPPGAIYGLAGATSRSQQPLAPPPPAYTGYQHSSTLLSQNVPRPLPPQAFQTQQSTKAGNPVMQSRPSQAAGDGANMSEQNPLFLLSQAHAQMNSGASGTQGSLPETSLLDLNEDDTVLAAAALSGLSTPRTAYVGGPAPAAAVALSHLNAAANNANMNLQPPIARAQTGQVQGELAESGSGTDSAGKKTGKAAGKGKGAKKGAAVTADTSASSATASGSKRKKAASPPPGNDVKKLKRAPSSRRKTAVVAKVEGGTPEARGSYDSEHDVHNGGPDGEGDNDDGMSMASGGGDDNDGSGGKGGKQQSFETEDDKRKNFLERNRQAALKCRQRKKQWLTDLQQRVENLTQDNEVLHRSCNMLRDEVTTLRNILLAHRDCPIGQGGPQGGGNGVTVGNLLAAQANQGQQAFAQAPPAQPR